MTNYGKGRSPADFARRSALKKTSRQKESKISLALRHNLHRILPGSVWWKNAGSEFGEGGLPDIMGVVRGLLICIEVKQGNGWFSPLQVQWLKKAEKAGAVAIGMVFKDGECFIIPTTAMGHKGNRHQKMWIKIEYPEGLKDLPSWSVEV
jgi:hypothetical protein